MDQFKDLEYLIFLGFIPLKIKVGGINFVFKSINELEFEKIKLYCGIKEDIKYNYLFHINYILYSLFLINGENVLPIRDKEYSKLLKRILFLPNFLIKKIFDSLSDLTRRQEVCLEKIESYCYSETSRYRWEQKKGIELNSLNSTTVLGTENLGLNQFQVYWKVFNIREDRNEVFEENYSLAKFVASFWDPKAVRKIDNSDKAKKEELKSRRGRISSLGKNDFNKINSVENLVDELNRSIEGIKDEHDILIEEHEKKLRADMLEQMKEIKKIREDRIKTFNPNLEEARTITPEEMIKRIEQNKKRSSKIFSPEEHVSKFLQMTNVSDNEVADQVSMSKEEYTELINDDLFSSIKKEQKIENKSLDFPNLRKNYGGH